MGGWELLKLCRAPFDGTELYFSDRAVAGTRETASSFCKNARKKKRICLSYKDYRQTPPSLPSHDGNEAEVRCALPRTDCFLPEYLDLGVSGSGGDDEERRKVLREASQCRVDRKEERVLTSTVGWLI